MLSGECNTANFLPNEVIREYNKTRSFGHRAVLCYAPFKNLYFGHGGKVISCCYNQNHILGTYPQRSIKEIWFGKEAEQLRQFILHNDLSLGCQNCRYHLMAGNFDAAKTKMFDGNRKNENNYPSVLEMELNNTCNLECIMCSGRYSSSIRKNKDNLPPVEEVYDDRFLNQLKEFIPYLEAVKFYGGEPFLIDIYYRIWDLIARLNPQCRIYVQTNGTILNNRVREILDRCNFDIAVSTESLEKEKYENIRFNGKFETVMENILYFREYTRKKNAFFGISVCAIRQNWHEIPAFVNFCNRLDAMLYIHTVWQPPNCSLWNLDSGELGKIASCLRKFSAPQSTVTEKKNAGHFIDFLRQTESWLERRKPIYDKVDFPKTGNEKIYIDNLCDRIRAYVHSLPGQTDPEKENRIIKKFHNIMDRIPNALLREKIVSHMDTISIEVIISNLESNSEEKILNQAIAFGELLFFE